MNRRDNQFRKKKLLYIDVPFAGESDGAKNRSKFIWKSINKNFDSDLMLMKTSENVNIHPHNGYNKMFT